MHIVGFRMVLSRRRIVRSLQSLARYQFRLGISKYCAREKNSSVPKKATTPAAGINKLGKNAKQKGCQQKVVTLSKLLKIEQKLSKN